MAQSKETLRKQQLEQACKYMHALDYYADAVERFRRDGTVYKSIGKFGSLFDLDDTDRALVAKVEAQTGCKVYACIEHWLGDDECLTMLVVSKYPEDWDYEEADVNTKGPGNTHYAFSWVENKSCDWCSEFGTVVVQSVGGGLRRIA